MKKINTIQVIAVDDSVVQRSHVVDVCRRIGIEQVDQAENGLDAIEHLKNKKYDLAFIDLEMPVMDGIELVRHIAAHKLVDSVIILSSKDPVLILSVGTMAESDGLKVLGTFRKPIMKEQLENSLNRLLSQGIEAIEGLNTTDLSAKDLLDAIENHEIYLKFQPKLTVKGLVLNGVEALARWQHPTLGNIPPDQFISLAERFGLIDKLTYYLYERAIKSKLEWRNFGVNFHLAFNLSPLSIAEKSLADNVSEMTAAHNIPPNEIVLEITENTVSGEISSAIETLAKLRLKGFKIAIDDYGTGFANAQQLSRVPATELKLDRSLIDGVATRPQQQAIVRSTLSLAKELGLITVAEGVEHIEDYQFLKENNVELVQGYLFARPMASDELLIWLKDDLVRIRKSVLSSLK